MMKAPEKVGGALRAPASLGRGRSDFGAEVCLHAARVVGVHGTGLGGAINCRIERSHSFHSCIGITGREGFESGLAGGFDAGLDGPVFHRAGFGLTDAFESR